ncbi:hypothetical protein EDD15DRAFT_2197745 [Pisolithus albus]|nr:hypothetical protein EDD15DRAFT_2197745 [Pisolithus albus]
MEARRPTGTSKKNPDSWDDIAASFESEKGNEGADRKDLSDHFIFVQAPLISKTGPMIRKWKNKLRVEIRKNLESMFDYEADFYDGPTTLVVPKDRLWYRSGAASDFDTGADDHNGWDARIKNLDMKVAAGSHDTMFTPVFVNSVLVGVVKEILGTVPGAGSMDTTSSPKIRKASKAKGTNGHAP